MVWEPFPKPPVLDGPTLKASRKTGNHAIYRVSLWHGIGKAVRLRPTGKTKNPESGEGFSDSIIAKGMEVFQKCPAILS